MVTKFAMTVSVNMMASQRWVCRIHLLTLASFESNRAYCAYISPPLDHLPAIAGRIAEARIPGAVTLYGLLGELHAALAHLFVGGAAIIDGKHKRRHGALGHDLAHGLRSRRVDGRRLRLEQAE